MTSFDLFLALSVSQSDSAHLEKSLSAYLDDNSQPILKKISYEGRTYVGKSLSCPLDFSSIDSIESHIYSVLTLLFPAQNWKEKPLSLIALPNP